MRNTTISQLLAEERKKRKLKVDDVCRLTRIRKEYIEALESGNFETLPPAVFVKGYIKSYSQLLGIEYKPLWALLRRDYKESAKGELVPREFLQPVLRRGFEWQPITLLGAGLAVVFVTIVGYVGFQWYQLQQPPELVVDTPTNGSTVGPTVLVQGQSDPDVVVSINTMPVNLSPDGSFEKEITFLSEGISNITIEAQDSRGKKSLVQHSVNVQF